MLDQQEESVSRAAGRHTEAPAGEEVLLERVIGELRPSTGPEAPSLLRPQQHRNAVWRWHIRRRRRS